MNILLGFSFDGFEFERIRGFDGFGFPGFEYRVWGFKGFECGGGCAYTKAVPAMAMSADKKLKANAL